MRAKIFWLQKEPSIPIYKGVENDDESGQFQVMVRAFVHILFSNLPLIYGIRQECLVAI